ncbi:MAG TPA: ATP-binding protein, partial [Terriglobales bacterium]|nr:ATP-binding protein [Terriglobales bacterium]
MIFKPAYNVFVANGGQQALDIVRSAQIDVVTLDLRMPAMSGVEVMERIKALDPDIEVIIVTGYSSIDSAVAALRHGVFDYVSKPFDVSEIRDLVNRAVKRRRESLRSRRAKEDFLANVSHELRTPLNAILGYTAMLAEELEQNLHPDLQHAIYRLQASSYDMFRLVENVLLLNEIESGELQPENAPFDMRSAVEIAVNKFAAQASKKGIELRADLPSEELRLISDRDKVERVIWALLDNAIKFTDAGRVTITAQRLWTDQGIEIQVHDTGIGMAPEEKETALSGLSQVDPSSRRKFSGLGLGLRIATRLLDLLGGTLCVQSAPGQGTIVVAELPLQPPEPGPQLH